MINLVTNNFKYNGDFSQEVVIGRKIPDWINIKEKQIIELFGEPFHNPNHRFNLDIKYSRTEKGLIEHYAKYGYSCMVIWSKELNNPKSVIYKIRKFIYGKTCKS